jgi:hypothetical protein
MVSIAELVPGKSSDKKAEKNTPCVCHYAGTLIDGTEVSCVFASTMVVVWRSVQTVGWAGVYCCIPITVTHIFRFARFTPLFLTELTV